MMVQYEPTIFRVNNDHRPAPKIGNEPHTERMRENRAILEDTKRRIEAVLFRFHGYRTEACNEELRRVLGMG